MALTEIFSAICRTGTAASERDGAWAELRNWLVRRCRTPVPLVVGKSMVSVPKDLVEDVVHDILRVTYENTARPLRVALLRAGKTYPCEPSQLSADERKITEGTLATYLAISLARRSRQLHQRWGRRRSDRDADEALMDILTIDAVGQGTFADHTLIDRSLELLDELVQAKSRLASREKDGDQQRLTWAAMLATAVGQTTLEATVRDELARDDELRERASTDPAGAFDLAEQRVLQRQSRLRKYLEKWADEGLPHWTLIMREAARLARELFFPRRPPSRTPANGL